MKQFWLVLWHEWLLKNRSIVVLEWLQREKHL